MTGEASSTFRGQFEDFARDQASGTAATLVSWLDQAQLVGDAIRIDYSDCDILVHDKQRQAVGGLPLGCFLLASRLAPGEQIADATAEDSCLLLLRVIAKAKLPNDMEADSFRFEAGQRAADTARQWDDQEHTDGYTLNKLRFAGVHCRILGTFRAKKGKGDAWALSFGSDISNFYSGRGMKVYKPIGPALSQIVNFTRDRLEDAHALAGQSVEIGRVRYASAERLVDTTGDNVAVRVDPTDLIARRSALFGMSRTGKSNTTKIIAASVFALRARDAVAGKVAQLIFDANGEYANENMQDRQGTNPSCLKLVGQRTPNAEAADVSTYGLVPHPNDPNRKMMRINFFGLGYTNSDAMNHDRIMEALDQLLVGQRLIQSHLSQEQSKYIRSFRDTSLEPPLVLDRSEAVRFRRRLLVYRAVLATAGFQAPSALARPTITGLFNKELLTAMGTPAALAAPDGDKYQRAAAILANADASWSDIAEAARGLRSFIEADQFGYGAFNQQYRNTHEGRSWHDEGLTSLLAIFEYPNGPRSLIALKDQHDPNSVNDFAQAVIDDLGDGRLVIIDQSLGDEVLKKAAAERIMKTLFERQQRAFVQPQVKDGQFVPPQDVIVYVEEAHTLLPAATAKDITNIWARTAKEGSKYRIGLVYATQEPSTIQSNILKNTDNWFVAHLNNSDEIKEIKKYYDFDDFAVSIQRVPDAGFLRVRTLSNPYIVPVQIKRFVLPEA